MVVLCSYIMVAASRNASEIRTELVPRYIMCKATEKNMHDGEQHKNEASVVFI